MVHRARAAQTKAGQHQAMAPAPAPGPLYHGGPGVAGGGDQMSVVCQCNTFLDPYPSGQSAQWRSLGGGVPLSSALQHFCRVCNTQLNSCKQARIHVAGKKHEKRLAYLKFSLETSEAVTGSYTHTASQPMAQPLVTSGLPTVHSVYAYPPPCGAPTYAPAPAPAAYYFPPAPSYQPPHHTITYHYDQQPPAPPPPASSASHSLSHYPPHSSHTACASRRGKATASGGNAAASHGVMSPSLTSGFSGSGDCSGSKSTETCSLLSVASYSSATPTSHAQSAKEGGGAGQVQSSGDRGRHLVQCEVCHLPFPSRAVLEHHLMGSRHARKVKAESVLRQLQENGAEFRAREATGDIRCEVCEVSVNSSHQLQAHMTGHKHKMRCARQGVAPNKTILTPASSTAPSTTPSEASAPVRSYSILVGRPQFGSRPNLYKTTATARGGGHRRSQGPGLGEIQAARGRLAGVSSLNKLSKARKFVRPRLKTEPGSRAGRVVKLGGGAEGGRGANVAADSTTESDDAGTSKQKIQILAKKQETDLDATEALDEADDSDEAKESEADQDSPPPPQPPVVTSISSAVSHMARASQTEPLRRLSVDGCDLLPNKNDQQGQSEDQHKEPQTKISKELTKEPRRRSVSASYSQSLISNNNNNVHNCNLCQISVNSQSQLAQHMSSNKHRRLSAALQSHMGSGPSSGSGRGKWWSEGGVTKESLAGAGAGQAGARECNVREIPMLSMFLQRLHQHHYFPPIRDEEDVSSETHR